MEVIKQNHKEVTVNVGEEVQLTCTADVRVTGCSFIAPGDRYQRYRYYPMFIGAVFEDGRIKEQTLNPDDCSMVITKIQESDNGQWECTVAGRDSLSGDLASGSENINVVVVTGKNVPLMKTVKNVLLIKAKNINIRNFFKTGENVLLI